MTTSSEDSVELEAKTVRTPRHSHRKSRRRRRIAARILLILALVIGFLSIFDFTYNAIRRADCYTGDGGAMFSEESEREGCIGEVARRDQLLQLDAAAAMLAAAFLITSTVISRRIMRHRRLTTRQSSGGVDDSPVTYQEASGC
jgi:hypothetical protein